jgi:glutathione S-transferase
MALTLYTVHGSHPCAAVAKALQMKGLEYRVIEWPPPLHPAMQTLLFGKRTVPALRNGAEKISGTREILLRLDEMVPEPAMFPADHDERLRVDEAERWGDQFQQVARDLIWVGFSHRPGALVSYSEHSRLPLPPPVVRLVAPGAAQATRILNRTNDRVALKRLKELPGQVERIDGWIEAGTIGDVGHPNAADLQIFSTLRLLYTMADLRPLLEGKRATVLALELFPQWDGEMPAGALPSAA